MRNMSSNAAVGAGTTRGIARTSLALRAGIVALAVQAVATTAAFAEQWKQVGGWTIVGSAAERSCTMGTRYTSGAIMVLRLKETSEEEQDWELLVVDSALPEVEGGAAYPVDFHLLGDAPARLSREMLGYAQMGRNGLIATFSSQSELSDFIADGMSGATQIALSFDGGLMGSYSLKGANAAYAEVKKCYAAKVQTLDS